MLISSANISVNTFVPSESHFSRAEDTVRMPGGVLLQHCPHLRDWQFYTYFLVLDTRQPDWHLPPHHRRPNRCRPHSRFLHPNPTMNYMYVISNYERIFNDKHIGFQTKFKTGDIIRIYLNNSTGTNKMIKSRFNNIKNQEPYVLLVPLHSLSFSIRLCTVCSSYNARSSYRRSTSTTSPSTTP